MKNDKTAKNDDKTVKTQCGNPCSSSGDWNHSCTSELVQDDFTMAA